MMQTSSMVQHHIMHAEKKAQPVSRICMSPGCMKGLIISAEVMNSGPVRESSGSAASLHS